MPPLAVKVSPQDSYILFLEKIVMKRFTATRSSGMALGYCILLFILSGCVSSTSSYQMPAVADSTVSYLFFLHGTITEKHGPYATHPRRGTYDYYRMLNAFSERGFTVISEVRAKGTDIEIYAGEIAAQIDELLSQGVPPEHISVVGFSKGGAITLYVSSYVKNPKVSYVVMAGCGTTGKYRKRYDRFLEGNAAALSGRILSLFDSEDSISGSCREALEQATDNTAGEERILSVGLGHGTFYQPRDEWLQPVVQWINAPH